MSMENISRFRRPQEMGRGPNGHGVRMLAGRPISFFDIYFYPNLEYGNSYHIFISIMFYFYTL